MVRFYLDYVGCKDNIYMLEKGNINSFISTMWDVKYFELCFLNSYYIVLSRLCGM